ncbi:MAG: cyclase family protein [Janthinobacterium lividum]
MPYHYRFCYPALLALGLGLGACTAPPAAPVSLWDVYTHTLQQAKYVDLTHTITPRVPVAAVFGHPTFARSTSPATGHAYDYQPDGFASTDYHLPTDQLGTQLDPPAHWSADYPAIDELPPTFAVRPLVVISMVEQLRAQPGYQLKVADVQAWERAHSRIPAGSVVMVRSDWSKRWPDPKLATERVFPGIELAALQFLHQQRHILFHGHEPLDTDTTRAYQAEAWLLRNGYCQAEGVCCLDQVPETGALVAIGYPKFGGGVGGLARYIAICPPGWPFGTTIDTLREAPLPKLARPLHWNAQAGMRVR